MKKCYHCNKFFQKDLFANHVRWCEANPISPRTKFREKIRKIIYEKTKRKNGEKKHFFVECQKCKTLLNNLLKR